MSADYDPRWDVDPQVAREEAERDDPDEVESYNPEGSKITLTLTREEAEALEDVWSSRTNPYYDWLGRFALSRKLYAALEGSENA